VLPLAMVALRGNLVEWVDPFMVRRETGAERPAGMDFGFGARALREAHLLQYQRHLVDALNANADRDFAATHYLDALPPVGQFPATALDPSRMTQRFFPAGIEVELSFIPEDELPAVIEEALLMPPIDLTSGLDALAGTGVVVLVPLSRADFNSSRLSLPNWDADLPRLRPAFQQIKAQASPRELLLSRLFKPVQLEDTAAVPWRSLLQGALSRRLLWYVRRRYLPIPANIAGAPVAADSVSISSPGGLRLLVEEDQPLAEGLNRLRDLDSPEVTVLTRRLSERRFVDNPALLRTIVMNAAGPKGTTPTPETAVTALAPTTDPALGEGLTRLTAESATLSRTLNSDRVVESGVLVEVDKLAREVPPERLTEFATELRTAVRTGEDIPVNIAKLRTRFGTTP
jgi:hypothetical protein